MAESTRFHGFMNVFLRSDDLVQVAKIHVSDVGFRVFWCLIHVYYGMQQPRAAQSLRDYMRHKWERWRQIAIGLRLDGFSVNRGRGQVIVFVKRAHEQTMFWLKNECSPSPPQLFD